LYIGGFLSRAAYEFELLSVKKSWETTSSRLDSSEQDAKAKLSLRVLHALKFFMFSASTPSPEVSNLLEAAFFDCSTNGQFPVISNKGVLDIGAVRLPDPTFAGFLKELPVLPDTIMSEAPLMITSLQNRGMVKAINFQDVLRELQQRPLTEDEFVACLKWWINIFQAGERERLLSVRTQLINSIILTITQNDEQKVIPLSSIKSFINAKTLSGSIPVEGPLPDYLLPVSVSKLFKPEVLLSCFPWSELSVVQWISFLCEAANLPTAYDMTLSPPWSEKIIGVVTRAWPSLTVGSKSEIIRLLSNKKCIPTSVGMVFPQQAYFPNVNIFGDLPVIVWSSGALIKGTSEKVLQELGVRKHVDLQIIFNRFVVCFRFVFFPLLTERSRMIKTNEWTIADLTKYLVSVRSSLTAEEFERLKATSAFPVEISGETANSEKRSRYKANQLYEPLDVFRSLNLPVIDWGQQTKWRSSSDEGMISRTRV